MVHQFTMCNSIPIKLSKHQIIDTVHRILYVRGNQAKITVCCQMSLVVQYFLKTCWTQIYNPTCNPTVPDLHIHIDDWVEKKINSPKILEAGFVHFLTVFATIFVKYMVYMRYKGASQQPTDNRYFSCYR